MSIKLQNERAIGRYPLASSSEMTDGETANFTVMTHIRCQAKKLIGIALLALAPFKSKSNESTSPPQSKQTLVSMIKKQATYQDALTYMFENWAAVDNDKDIRHGIDDLTERLSVAPYLENKGLLQDIDRIMALDSIPQDAILAVTDSTKVTKQPMVTVMRMVEDAVRDDPQSALLDLCLVVKKEFKYDDQILTKINTLQRVIKQSDGHDVSETTQEHLQALLKLIGDKTHTSTDEVLAVIGCILGAPATLVFLGYLWVLYHRRRQNRPPDEKYRIRNMRTFK